MVRLAEEFITERDCGQEEDVKRFYIITCNFVIG